MSSLFSFIFLSSHLRRNWREKAPDNGRTKSQCDIYVLVARQPYHVTVPDDSVIVGNDVVIRCNIPSFVTDFLSVIAWVNSEGSEFHPSTEVGKGNSLSSSC